MTTDDQPLTDVQPGEGDQPLTDASPAERELPVTDDDVPEGADDAAGAERVDEDVAVEDPDGSTELDEDLEAVPEATPTAAPPA